MATPDRRIKFSYADYKSLPESETRRYELLDGELVMVPSPTEYHQRILRKLAFPLLGFVEACALGQVYFAPLDVVLGQGAEREVVQPDLFYIGKEREGIIAAEEIRGAPDLVIEVLSPATAERDRTYKRTLYARHGVREYWLVDPETRSIEVLTHAPSGFQHEATYRAGANAVLTSPLLPGLQIPLSEIF